MFNQQFMTEKSKKKKYKIHFEILHATVRNSNTATMYKQLDASTIAEYNGDRTSKYCFLC